MSITPAIPQNVPDSEPIMPPFLPIVAELDPFAAARTEYVKLERTLTDAEIKGWV